MQQALWDMLRASAQRAFALVLEYENVLLGYRSELELSADGDSCHRYGNLPATASATRSRAKLLAVLAKAPDVEPELNDRLPK
jgi:hypothetical protein